MSKSSKSKEYKFKAQVYETKDKNEQTFHQKLANKEQQEIIFQNRNLNQYAPELFNSQLEYFFSLKKLILENCDLEFFTPRGLTDIEVLSLEGNKIPDLNSIVFYPPEEESSSMMGSAKKKSRETQSGKKAAKSGNNKIELQKVKLRDLNLSDNRFEKFPYECLHKMGAYLTILNISRNRIRNLKGDGPYD